MKYFSYIFLFFLISCSTPFSKVERVYICGDHECKNDKEIKEYFANNISIEVFTVETSKNQDERFDLAELNMLEDKLKSDDKIKISEKKQKIRKDINERKRIAKLKIKKIEEPQKIIKTVKTKPPSKITFIRICKNLKECDIDKISKIIMDIGKNKDFPNITN